MKGSPMQRNFGIGGSPAKHKLTDPKNKDEYKLIEHEHSTDKDGNDRWDTATGFGINAKNRDKAAKS